MSSESIPTITEADIQKMLANVREVAIDFNTVLAENRFLKERNAELEDIIARGKPFVPRRPLKFIKVEDIPGTPTEKAECVRRMMEARRA